MATKAYNDGLMSRIKNSQTNKKYTLSTSKELGKDYWTSTIFHNVFFGLFPNLTKPVFTVVRNNKQEAHQVHYELERLAEVLPESEWLYKFPKPLPADGLTKDAKATLAEY